MTSRKSASSSPHDARYTFEYDDTGRARRVEQSLRPETGDLAGDRTQVTLDRDGSTLTLTVEATDMVALRAGSNTWLTLVSVAERAGE